MINEVTDRSPYETEMMGEIGIEEWKYMQSNNDLYIICSKMFFQ